MFVFTWVVLFSLFLRLLTIAFLPLRFSNEFYQCFQSSPPESTRSLQLPFVFVLQPFIRPLNVLENLKQHAQGNEDLTLRRFSRISYTEPLPPQVQCCFKECQFLASPGVAMIEHHGTANIQGEKGFTKKIKRKCGRAHILIVDE